MIIPRVLIHYLLCRSYRDVSRVNILRYLCRIVKPFPNLHSYTFITHIFIKPVRSTPAILFQPSPSPAITPLSVQLPIFPRAASLFSVYTYQPISEIIITPTSIYRIIPRSAQLLHTYIYILTGNIVYVGSNHS